MSARNQVGWLIKQGNSPGEIAIIRKVSEDVTKRSLLLLVGEGRLRRSDIYYSIPREIRDVIVTKFEERNKRHSDYQKLYRSLSQSIRRKFINAKKLDIELAIGYYSSRIEMGDLYEDIRNIELFLNKLVKDTLIEIYKDNNEIWWFEGVPEDIRKECAVRREGDNINRTEIWNYISLIHLKKILDKQWQMFMSKFIKEIKTGKKQFMYNLVKLNSIRNSVMHPSRNDKITEDDFEFIRKLKDDILPEKKQEFYEPKYIGKESEQFSEFLGSFLETLNDEEGMHLVPKDEN